jgi:thymidine phosphorylase
VQLPNKEHYIIAILNMVKFRVLKSNEVGLSEYAWKLLGAKEGSEVILSHPEPLLSLSYIRGKIYGKPFTEAGLNMIVKDIVTGHLSDIQVSSFITSCAGDRLSKQEIVALTKAMVNIGDRIVWPSKFIVDKHCVGGLPGNRTTPIVVPIVAAFGLTIPKTSSRAITSSAGTADTMEVLTNVDLSFSEMKKIVERENGCLAWGGAASLSPADDIIIRVESTLNLDSTGQLVASILSKKIAAGSTHILIDVPIGPTAKIRTMEEANLLKDALETVGKQLDIIVNVIFTDGFQPVGCGIGPALEARDVLAVLQNKEDAPQDLKERAILLAGKIIEFSSDVKNGEGADIAKKILDTGEAWRKFQAICEAQGGIKIIPKAQYMHDHISSRSGKVLSIDNRHISRLAKLAGAPHSKAAGVDLHVHIDTEVRQGQPILTLHSQTPGELSYALDFLKKNEDLVQLG